MARQLYLVSYDVRHPKRLYRALYILKDYACAGQKSVFECWLDKKEKLELRTRLAHHLDIDSDSILFSHLNKAHAIRSMGIAPKAEDIPFMYLG